MTLPKRAEEFMRHLFHSYLELRDFDAFLAMLSPDITWIGTGQHEVCHNAQEAQELIAAEQASWDGHFRILDSWYQPIPISADCCAVVGELRLEEETPDQNVITMEMHTRFSAICQQAGGAMQLLHIHFSLPSVSQHKDEFVHDTLLQSYNQRLEQKLAERTATLLGKTEELELLAAELRRQNLALQQNDQLDSPARIASELQLYDAMLSRSATMYEINITKDLLVSGHENWGTVFGIQPSSCYTAMIRAFAKCSVCAEDAPEFLRVFDRVHVLASFAAGSKDLYCEYRRPDPNHGLIWVSSTMHLFLDSEKGDVRGFDYVQNINDKKLQQLELLYQAERDHLTGLYNKVKTQQLIDAYLLDAGKEQRHALFIFDLDHFKEVNDTRGHAFGDVVLSRAAGKALELFRDVDIVGRVGGDEFVILMKNIDCDQSAERKAEEMRQHLQDIYFHKDRKLAVSISVGTALYPSHGTDYQTLFERADIALYTAKENGRNQAATYRESLSPAPTRVAAMDASDLLESRSFQRNVSEYIFRILYETADKAAAIHAVLEVVGKQYCVSRAYIFEESSDAGTLSNTFEWCNTGVEAQLPLLQNLSYEDLGYYPDNFDELGIFYLPDADRVPSNLHWVLSPQGIKTMLQFAILRNGEFTGLVGFDFCERKIEPTKAEITVLKTAANMLGVFLYGGGWFATE